MDWVFSRELLATGLRRPIGSGDVQVWPCRNTTGEAVVVIELHAPNRKGLLQAPAGAVRAFVREVFEAVPFGTEGSHVDMDELVDRLLS